MAELNEQVVLDSLKQIIDPDLRKDIVSLGFIKDLKIEAGDVSFRIVLTTPACPVKDEMEAQAQEIVSNLEGVSSVKVTMDAEVPQGRGVANNVAIKGIKNIIAVSSGNNIFNAFDRAKAESENRPSPSILRFRLRSTAQKSV